MSLIAEYKICPKCHKRYGWNPDVGMMSCPYCAGIKLKIQGNPVLDIIKNIKQDIMDKK